MEGGPAAIVPHFRMSALPLKAYLTEAVVMSA
jgi:hypothetical protein